jgi:ABC-type tungstate transport system substrate-binding protein
MLAFFFFTLLNKDYCYKYSSFFFMHVVQALFHCFRIATLHIKYICNHLYIIRNYVLIYIYVYIRSLISTINPFYKWNIVYTQRKFMISFTYFNMSVIIASLTQRYLWHLHYSVMHVNIPFILQVPLSEKSKFMFLLAAKCNITS